MNIIVMMDETGCIGIDDDQPVRLQEDLARFKKFTNHKIVVCGRKTVSTFPDQAPLKNRSTIVVSKTLNKAHFLMYPDRNVIVVSNPFEIIEMLKDINSSDIWVIGGASIYREFLPLVSRVYLTQVHTIFQRGITNTLNSHDMLNPTKVYFPINILDEQFERIESTEIEDIDIFTKRRYKTTFSEYIRL